MDFSEKLVRLRKQHGITQQEAANFIGRSLRTYVSYERDGRYPRSHEIYEKLALLYDVDVNYLYVNDEPALSIPGDDRQESAMHQAMQLVTGLSGIFAGGDLNESDKDAIMISLVKAYFDSKKKNPQQAAPHRMDTGTENHNVSK
ncbi:MAG: helix-turn-helix domain-containing protein [Anaerovoracaceae bacterium]|jgi:transcriptional regulator with XRE-family HTH domain